MTLEAYVNRNLILSLLALTDRRSSFDGLLPALSKYEFTGEKWERVCTCFIAF